MDGFKFDTKEGQFKQKIPLDELEIIIAASI